MYPGKAGNNHLELQVIAYVCPTIRELSLLVLWWLCTPGESPITDSAWVRDRVDLLTE